MEGLESYEDYLGRMTAKFEKDPYSFGRISLTAMLHQIEREKQDYAKPRVFLKEVDEEGFVHAFELNKMYGSLESYVEKTFDSTLRMPGGGKLTQDLLDNFTERPVLFQIYVMGTVNSIENSFFSAFKKTSFEERFRMQPPIMKVVYDSPQFVKESGMLQELPTSYGLNKAAVTLRMSDSGPSIELKDPMISDEEIRNIDIDNLLDRFFNIGDF